MYLRWPFFCGTYASHRDPQLSPPLLLSPPPPPLTPLPPLIPLPPLTPLPLRSARAQARVRPPLRGVPPPRLTCRRRQALASPRSPPPRHLPRRGLRDGLQPARAAPLEATFLPAGDATCQPHVGQAGQRGGARGRGGGSWWVKGGEASGAGGGGQGAALKGWGAPHEGSNGADGSWCLGRDAA